MPETAEELRQQPDVREELAKTTGVKVQKKVKAETKDKFWFGTHVLLLICCAAAYWIIGSKLVPLAEAHVDLARRALRGTAIIVALLAIAKGIVVYGIGRIEDPSTRFTLKRIVHLIVALAIAVIAISMIFVNWYTALTALGIGSVIVGLAVQTPMTSF